MREKKNNFDFKDNVESLLNRIALLKDETNLIIHKLVYKGSLKEINEIPIEIIELLKK